MQHYHVGQNAELSRTFEPSDVATFADLSGDTNPIHLDAAYAEQSPFGAQIVHGMLVSSLFSTLFGTQLPGEGVIYLGQTLQFRAPVYFGDTITARVELIKLREDKPIGTFACRCTNQSGDTVIDGEAVLKLP